jgi:peptidoglycan/xylan/chitin deacetylase (PgdA/CDA1 family)
MSGAIMVTLDCEGKWGVADHLTGQHHALMTDQRLEEAYRRTVDILRTHDIQATFAFVGAFALDLDEFQSLDQEIGDLSRLIPAWFAGFRAAQAARRGHEQGWFGKRCLQAARAPQKHEIASHGFSHVPWIDSFAGAEALEQELRLVRGIPGFDEQTVSTFVYPRNLVGHPELLSRYGFTGYRDSRPTPGRLANLISEFNVLVRSDMPGPDSQPARIPSGYFLNWRSGPRRLVPPGVTLMRWRRICREASERGGIAHLWCHPENFVTAEGMYDLFSGAMAIASEECSRGQMSVLTQRQYVESLAGRSPAG